MDACLLSHTASCSRSCSYCDLVTALVLVLTRAGLLLERALRFTGYMRLDWMCMCVCMCLLGMLMFVAELEQI